MIAGRLLSVNGNFVFGRRVRRTYPYAACAPALAAKRMTRGVD